MPSDCFTGLIVKCFSYMFFVFSQLSKFFGLFFVVDGWFLASEIPALALCVYDLIELLGLLFEEPPVNLHTECLTL